MFLFGSTWNKYSKIPHVVGAGEAKQIKDSFHYNVQYG